MQSTRSFKSTPFCSIELQRLKQMRSKKRLADVGKLALFWQRARSSRSRHEWFKAKTRWFGVEDLELLVSSKLSVFLEKQQAYADKFIDFEEDIAIMNGFQESPATLSTSVA